MNWRAIKLTLGSFKMGDAILVVVNLLAHIGDGGIHHIHIALLLGYAVLQLQGTLGIWQTLGFTVALLMGGLLIYCFWLILTTGAFWIIRMENILELFQGVYQAGRYPVTIYPGWLQSGLTFLVPIAFAVTVPAEALTQRPNGETLLLAAGLTTAFLVVARWFWFFGLRHYAGASA
jgi:ABC-2 type transport system permease protein